MTKTRIWIAAGMAVMMSYGQELRVARFSLEELEKSEVAAMAQQAQQQQPQQQDAPVAAPTSASRTSKTRTAGSHRKKWIIIAAIAGGAAITVWAVNKRLSNEGAGIF